jgi:hypothetical protein
MSKGFLLVLEIIWIATGTLSVAAGIKYAMTTGGPRTFIFFGLAIVCILFAWLRHRERKNR